MTNKPDSKPTKKDPHPGMMGDGTEEQNLGQPGNPAARIKAVSYTHLTLPTIYSV